MSIAKFEILQKVVELGSLTKAADALGFTQSGISHAISSLEHEFGLELLVRNRSGVRLTIDGERVFKHIRELLRANGQLKEEVAAIHGLETGTVRIGTFTSVSVHWLPGIIKTFQQDYPSIEIKLAEGDYTEIESWLLDGTIDCGFMSLPTLDSLLVTPLKQDKMLCLLPKDHPLAAQPSIRYADLAHEPFIMPKPGGDYDMRRLLAKQSLTPPVRFEAADDYAIIAMVEHGLGVSILPEMIVTGRKHGVVARELEDASCRSLGIATPSYVSPAAGKFITYVQRWLADWREQEIHT